MKNDSICRMFLYNWLADFIHLGAVKSGLVRILLPMG